MGTDAYMGEISIFAGTYAPVNWLFCSGQLLSISGYSALYALLGTTYGGDGRVNFGLPNLCGRTPIGTGSGPGLTRRSLGQESGYERIPLAEANLPAHQHTIPASTTKADSKVPTSSAALATQDRNAGVNIYSESGITTELKPTGSAGSGQAVENMQPWLALNYIICVNGLWPSRP